jgi:hypothetical protein
MMDLSEMALIDAEYFTLEAKDLLKERKHFNTELKEVSPRFFNKRN